MSKNRVSCLCRWLKGRVQTYSINRNVVVCSFSSMLDTNCYCELQLLFMITSKIY